MVIKGNYIIKNSQLLKTDEIANSGNPEKTVYEVLRIIDGIPLFFEEHFERLLHSCELIEKSIKISAPNLFDQLVELSIKNDFPFGNVVLKVLFEGDTTDLLIHFIHHSYPTENEYQNGVEVGFLEGERLNPEAKIIHASIREKANQIIADTGVYEVMLIDNNQKVTEGSRSNFFFIKKNSLYTSPLYKVLKGVTLTKVLDIAIDKGIHVHFEMIDLHELSQFDAMFISGTSPQIIAVAKAGKLTFDMHNQLIITITDEYQKLVDDDIAQKKRQLSRS